MERIRLSAPLLLLTIILVWAPGASAQHFQPAVTDVNMSFLIMEGTLDGQPLVAGDEIGAFTPAGLCAGTDPNGPLTDAGFPIGVSAYGDDANQAGINGFSAGDAVSFKVWDHNAQEEVEAEPVNFEDGEAIWQPNGFAVCSIAAERGEPEPSIVVSEEAHDFGAVRVGRSGSWDFTVRNVGRANLVIASMESDNNAFAVAFDEAVTLAPGASQVFTATFTPGAVQEYAGNVTIVSNDPANGRVGIRLIGMGEAALPPNITLSANDRRFGRVLIGQERSLSLFIGNNGDEPLTVSRVTVGNQVFRTNFRDPIQIAGGSRAELVITFAPQEGGVVQTDMVITSNDPDAGEVSVVLSGDGIEEGESPVVVVTADNHFYGEVVVGQSAAWRMVVTNIGGSDLHVSDARSNSNFFTVEFGHDTLRLRPGDYLYINTSFTPDAEAFYDGVITVASDDPDHGELSIPVGGVGVADDGRHFRAYSSPNSHTLLITAATLDGNALGAGAEIAVFTEWGLCAGAWAVDAQGMAGVPAYPDDPTSDIIDGFVADEPFSFKVWDPASRTEAWGAPDFEEGPDVFAADALSILTLAARTGEPAPDISLSAVRHYYGQVLVQQSEDWVLTITNRGRGQLRVLSIDSDVDEFSTDFEGAFDLALGQADTIVVTFAPTAQVDYEGRLTIVSDDPVDSVLYVDLFGVGVEEVREPEIRLGAANYFFGVVHLNDAVPYNLQIANRGGGQLRVDSVLVQGDDSFTTNWPGHPRTVDPGQAIAVEVTFRPAQARIHRAELVIFSDDPNDDVVQFAVEGEGLVSADHFLHRITANNHLFLFEEAILEMPGPRQSPLAPDDEIAVFTPAGLCAGHTVIEEAGVAVGGAAYGDDGATPVLDGFRNGEAFAFKYWDRSTRQELDAEPTYLEGPPTWTVNAMTRLTLLAHSDVVEAQIAVDPLVFNYGPGDNNVARTHIFNIQNIGGVPLTVTRIVSDMNVFTHNFNNQPTVIQPNGSIDVTVTFRPTDGISYEGVMTVSSDDPDQPQFVFRPVGMGSVGEGHYDFVLTDANHSILIEEFNMGGSPAVASDEVGVFTEAGFCAGASLVEQVGEGLGLAAMGDGPDTRYCIEGFEAGEHMTLKVWDASQGREYDPQIEIIDGELTWAPNGFTVININVPDVFSIVYDPPAAVNEGEEEVNIRFTLVNAPGNMQFSWLNPDTIAGNAGDRSFTDHGNNTADFHWAPNMEAAGIYWLRIQATDGNVTDRVTVRVQVNNVNQAPRVVNPFENDLVVVPEDSLYRAGPPARTDTLIVVPDLNQMFVDPDRNAMIFNFQPVEQRFYQQIRRVANVWQYRILIPHDYFGDVIIILSADDQQGMRQLRGVGGEQNDEAAVMSVADDLLQNDGRSPRRDVRTDYQFTLRVTAINDLPVIDRPANAAAFNITIGERQDLAVNFHANDVENQPAELAWAIFDRGQLPDEVQFSDDNNDGTWILAWQPPDGSAGVYRPRFSVTDRDNGSDTIQVNITVTSVNHRPEVSQVIPDYLDEQALLEDQPRDTLAILSDHFRDADQGQPIVYSLTAPPARLNLLIDRNSTALTAMPAPNYWQLDPDLVVTVRATDDSAAFIETSFRVEVHWVNDTARVIRQIAAINRGEDSNLNPTLISDLDNNFRDPDTLDVLTFRTEGAPDSMNLQINPNTHELRYRLARDFNTYYLDDHMARITVFATDTLGADTFITFNFTIAPVNDSIDARREGAQFNLANPENGFRIPYDPDSMGTVTLTWTPAWQNEWEIDSTLYMCQIYVPGGQDTLESDTLTDTSFANQAIDDLVRRFGMDREVDRTLTWRVWAIDTTGALRQRRVYPLNAPFTFIVPELEVREMESLLAPDHFFLSSSYPNPFNARTTLRIGLPMPADVDVSVWDMHGRKVAELAVGSRQAGEYELVWTADGMSSGIYIIKMQAGSFIALQKAILVR